MTTARIPIASPLESRTASLAKDGYSKNCYFEKKDQALEIVMRPGLTSKVTSIPVGQVNGMYASLTSLWAAVGSVLYKVTPSTNTSVSFGSIGSGEVYFNQTSETSGYTVLQDGSNVYYVAPAASSRTLVVGGTVISYTISVAGAGYTAVPTATITGGGGTSATANVFLGVVNAVISAAGSGYVVNDVLTFALTGGAATDQTSLTVSSVNGTGAITGLAIQTQGTYSTLPTLYGVSTPIALVGGSGTTATATLSWGTTSITANVAGSGYTYIPTITISAPAAGGTNATATPTISFDPVGPFATGLVYLDGYIFVATTSGRIYNSGIENPTIWNALDYLSAEAEPDPIVGIVKHFNYIVVFGAWSTEFFNDASYGTGSPLQRNDSYRLEIGCANGGSIVQIEQAVLWVGKSREHGKSVYIMEGLSPIKVSTPSIERYLNADQNDDVKAYAFKIEGHTFYVMTMHTQNITLVYDVDMKYWYNWTFYDGAAEQYFRPTYFSEFGKAYYAINDDNAIIYAMSTTTYSDDGATIYCGATTPIIDSGSNNRKFYRNLEIVGDKVAGTLQVAHSDDDYATWSSYRSVDLSAKRAIVYQCGQARRRSWRFLCTDAVPLRLSAAEIEFDIGGLETGQPQR